MQHSEPNKSHLDGRAVAAENERAVLELIHRYGHARCSEIARGVWAGSTQDVAEKMSYRTIKRLQDMKQVLVRRNALGGRSFVLARSGVTRLRARGIDAEAGYDLSSISGSQFFHRTLGTRYLIERSVSGHEAFGEYALARGRGPITQAELRQRFGKTPDGLVLVPGSEYGYSVDMRAVDWIEVESSVKPTKELERIFAMAWRYLGGPLDHKETMLLERLLFVYATEQGHESRILRALKRYVAAHPAPVQLLASIVLVRCVIDPPLVWRGREEFDCSMLR